MKSRAVLATILATVGLLAGCASGPEARIRKNPHIYNQLDPEAQYKVQQGMIDLGYTPEMVYLALGAPDERRDVLTSDGHRLVWIYSTYFERYEGTRHVGYQRRVYFDPRWRRYRVYHEPVYAETYRPEVQERIRVEFLDGRVTGVEQVR